MGHESAILSFTAERHGRSASYQVHGGSVLIGSSAHCEVRLAPEDAAPEQLRIELRGSEIHARLLSSARDCWLGDRRLQQGALPSGAQIMIGATRLRIELLQNAHAAQKSGARAALPPAARSAGFVGLALGLYFVMQPLPQPNLLEMSVEQPPLFAAEPARCGHGPAEETGYRAQRLLRSAQLLRERAPFHPEDGVLAVARYAQAGACFDALQAQREAADVAQQAASLRQSLQDEFHVRHVRLERLLKLKKFSAAQRELGVLQAFVSHKDGPYSQWLSAVQRELNTRFASAPKNG